MSLITSISGVRGIFGESLTPDIIIQYTEAFVAYNRIKKAGKLKFVIGRDGRITGKVIANLVSSTLISLGCDVEAIGVCPTPTVSLAVEKSDADGGISITASHNPIEWNGLKFFNENGLFLDADETKIFLEMLKNKSPKYVSWDELANYRIDQSWIDKHIELSLNLKYVNVESIRKKKFKIVLDCINAAGGAIIPELLKKLGCNVIEMNCDMSGVFTRIPEPLPENLTEVMQKVKEESADLGIVVDPDVDRLVLITEKGEPFGEEYTIASVINFILSKESESGKNNLNVVVNLSTTRAVDDIAKKFNVSVYRVPVGEINVAKEMIRRKSIVGGEGSGGVILPELHYARDALVGIVIVLQMLSEFDGTISDLKSELPEYFINKDKIDIKGIEPDKVLKEIHSKYLTEKTDTQDGLKIDFSDYWVHLRKSNTEPIIRIIAEAKSQIIAKNLVEELKKEIYNFTSSLHR